MWKKYIDPQIESMSFHRCSKSATGVMVRTIWRRHRLILTYKGSTISTRQRFLIYYLLLMFGAILTEPIFHTSSLVSRRHFARMDHNRYIIWYKPMSGECADVSYQPHSERRQKILQFPHLNSYSIPKLKWSAETKFVDWCLDMIRMHSMPLDSLIVRMDCGWTVNHFTAWHLLSIWDLIGK